MIDLVTGLWAQWQFDLVTFVIALFVPATLMVLGIIKKSISDWAVYIIEGIIYWFSRAIKHSVSARLSLKRYGNLCLEQQTKYVHIPAKTDFRLLIDNIYVPLTLEQNGLSTSLSDSTISSTGNRIRVIGDPGSGKSSMMKKLFRDQCRAAILSPSRAHFPFLLDLKSLCPPNDHNDDELGSWLLSLIKKH